MKKCFISFFLALVVICSLAGCQSQSAATVQDFLLDAAEAVSFEDVPADESSHLFNLEYIGDVGVFHDTFAYYRDVVTDVIYLRYYNKEMNAGMGGLTVMLDPETGLPLTYTRYMELANTTAEEG